MRHPRRTPARALAGLLAVIVLIAAGIRGGEGARPAGALRLALSTEPHSLDPILSRSIPDNDVLRLMFDPLIASDPAGRLVPALASVVPTMANGGISRDGRTVVYHLRHGVRWHDGVAFTSADVLFSTRAVLDPRNTVQSRRGYDQIAGMDAPDPWTVRFRLRRPFAPFVATVFSESDSPYYVIPAHAFRHGTLVEHDPFDAAPVGTGPFRIEHWSRGEAVAFAANRDYFRGAPRLARLTIVFTPDENTELVQLRTREIDGILHLSAASAAQLRGTAGTRVVATPGNGYYGLMFNTRRVADRRLRRALAQAIDGARFRSTITHGYDVPAVADLPAFLWAFDPTLRPIGYDPAAARAGLARAGYGPAHRLRLDLAIISTYRTHTAWAVELQAALAPLGVDLEIHPYRGEVFGAPAAENGVLANGRYDVAIYGWISGIDPDDSSQFLCDQRAPAGFNDSFTCSPEMDAAQHLALERYDQPARKRAYATIQRLLLRDVPIAFVATPAELTALAADVRGFSPNPICSTAFAERWALAR